MINFTVPLREIGHRKFLQSHNDNKQCITSQAVPEGRELIFSMKNTGWVSHSPLG